MNIFPVLLTAAENAAAAPTDFSWRLSYGLQVLVIGIFTVFLSMTILWGVMALFKLFFYTIPNKKKETPKAAEARRAPEPFDDVPEPEHIPLASDIPAASPASGADTQLIAVITAAIAAYQDTNGSALPFRVVSYRRAIGAGGWNHAAEEESI